MFDLLPASLFAHAVRYHRGLRPGKRSSTVSRNTRTRRASVRLIVEPERRRPGALSDVVDGDVSPPARDLERLAIGVWRERSRLRIEELRLNLLSLTGSKDHTMRQTDFLIAKLAPRNAVT